MFEFAPLILFFAAFVWKDFFFALIVLMVAAPIWLLAKYLITKKVIRLNGVISSKPHHIIRTVQMMDQVVKYPVEKLITHRFPLNDVNAAFKSHETWEAMVAVILPNG